MTGGTTSPNLRKMALQALAGGLFGFLAMSAVGSLVPELDSRLGGGAVALVAVGVAYVLMGVIVGVGTAIPALGTRILNNLDLDDLADQRRFSAAVRSAVCCLGEARCCWPCRDLRGLCRALPLSPRLSRPSC